MRLRPRSSGTTDQDVDISTHTRQRAAHALVSSIFHVLSIQFSFEVKSEVKLKQTNYRSVVSSINREVGGRFWKSNLQGW